jgi:hypothetical protein
MTTVITPVKEWAKRLRGIAKYMRNAASNQYNCCHGVDAETELKSAADKVDLIVKELDTFDVDQLRAELRSK